MIKKLTLTQDHLNLISNLKFTLEGDDKIAINKDGMYGGTFIMEDIALTIGKFNEAYPESLEKPTGREFPKELEDYMWNLHEYIWENIEFIMSLVLYYSTKGGLTPGTYKCIDYEKVWQKID
jgi:hypothetical protein